MFFYLFFYRLNYILQWTEGGGRMRGEKWINRSGPKFSSKLQPRTEKRVEYHTDSPLFRQNSRQRRVLLFFFFGLRQIFLVTMRPWLQSRAIHSFCNCNQRFGVLVHPQLTLWCKGYYLIREEVIVYLYIWSWNCTEVFAVLDKEEEGCGCILWLSGWGCRLI